MKFFDSTKIYGAKAKMLSKIKIDPHFVQLIVSPGYRNQNSRKY